MQSVPETVDLAEIETELGQVNNLLRIDHFLRSKELEIFMNCMSGNYPIQNRSELFI